MNTVKIEINQEEIGERKKKTRRVKKKKLVKKTDLRPTLNNLNLGQRNMKESNPSSLANSKSISQFKSKSQRKGLSSVKS